MQKQSTKPMTARQVASIDITEDCRKRKEGNNYLPYEADICESLGITKPNFRHLKKK